MKKLFRLILAPLASLLLCSFTPSPYSATDTSDSSGTDENQEKFDIEVSQLDPKLDENAVLGIDHEEMNNQLSEDDIDTISQFVGFDSSHIELDNSVYEERPVNDEKLCPDDYEEQYGVSYQDDNEEYKLNYRKLKYVSDNRALMNELTEQEYGIIDQNGFFQPYSSGITTQDIFSPNIWPWSDVKYGWFQVSFTANYPFTTFLGFMGCLVNFGMLKDIRDLFRSSKSDFFSDLIAVADDSLGEISTYFSQELMDKLEDLADIIYTFVSAWNCTSVVGRIITLFKYIIGHYLPCLTKGVIRMIGSLLYHYGSKNEIGLWWSNYNLLNYVLD